MQRYIACPNTNGMFCVVILKNQDNYQIGSYGQCMERRYKRGDTLMVDTFKREQRVLNGKYVITCVKRKLNVIYAQRR